MKCAAAVRARGAGRFERRLVLMVKSPEAGRVKTRLARQIGVVAATQFYRRESASALARLGADARWRTLVAVAPRPALGGRHWPRRFARLDQGRGDLGARMQAVFDHLPPGPVVIVGTDIPGIRPAHIVAAFRALGAADAVFGPAGDGGYWLVGLRRIPCVPRAFRGVRWSHPETLSDNRAALAPLDVATVATLHDVDNADDLHAARAVAGRRVLPAGSA